VKEQATTGRYVMSKHMQLKVEVRSYYAKDLGSAFPNLARHLSRLDPAWPERNPSLYELAGQLDKLFYASEGSVLGKLLRLNGTGLRKLFHDIEAHIADWQLAIADRLLYRLEDIFEEIERELAGM
jgi:hypothetical protein